MRFKLTLTVFFLIFSFNLQAQEYLKMIDNGTYKVSEIVESAKAYFEGKDLGRGSGYKQFKRWQYNAERLMNEDGFLPTATERIAELQRYNAYLNETASNRQQLMDNWEELGPTSYTATTGWNPGVGRITGIAVDRTNTDHIIVGANTGGVWRTTDEGTTWTPLNDNFVNMEVYSVAIDPQNSEIYFYGSSSGVIYKSEDSGATWNQLNDISNSRIIKLTIHPDNSEIMFASSENAGTYRTINGGLTWELVSNEQQAYDVEFKPGDPSVVYISGYTFQKSIDGGETFATISGFGNGPKMIGVSPNDVERVYVVEAFNGTFNGFYSSSNSGATFSELPHGGNNYFGYSTTANDNSGQAPRDMDIAVNPENADEVHIAGILTWRSTDAGANFTCTADWIPQDAANANIGYCHADVDFMEFVGTTLFVGTDGGIYKAADTGNVTANYYENLTEGMGIRQFYKIGVSQTEEVVITGGSQDNGTSFYTEADGWRDWLGADGMEGFVDRNNSNIMYGMIQFGAMYRTDNAGNSIFNLNEPGIGSGEWVTPFIQDPETINTIYVGYNRVYKSSNRGGSWTPISQQFPTNFTNIKIAKSNNQILFGTRGTFIYKTIDGGASDWELIAIPGGIINDIAIHPDNPNLIAAATTSSNRVFVSEDGGETWISYRKNLPDFGALTLIWHRDGKDGLYLGMETGVFYINNEMEDWLPYSNGIPNVIINELEINNTTNMLYAGSYGRGLWASPLQETTLNVEDRFSESTVSIFPNPANSQVTIALKNAQNTTIRVFDITGKIVLYQPDLFIAQRHTLQIENLASGTYFVRINSEAGTVTKKLLIQ